MIEINKNVVFVEGAHNGAIYDLNDGNVYSISPESCQAVKKKIHGDEYNSDEREYLNDLTEKGLLSASFSIHPYTPAKRDEKLRMCWLEITEQCNCRCVHCYEGQSHSKKADPLTLQEWKSVIDQLKALEVGNVIVIGGEPCTHPYIKEIVDYLGKNELLTTLFTNGTLIDPELRDIILRYKTRVKFSLYGHCAEIHDEITKRKGSFAKLQESISFFVQNGIAVNLSIVLMYENEQYYDKIIDYARSLGVGNYKFDVIREVYGGTQSAHTPQIPKIADLKKRKKPHFPKISKEQFDRAFYENTCWSGRMVVSEDGVVYPCVFERNMILGNVRDTSLAEIIESEPAKKCWEWSFDQVRECNECEFRFACKDCRPLAYGACSDLNAKNPRCTYNVYKGVWDE